MNNKNVRKLFLQILFLNLVICANSQSLSHVAFSNGTNLSSFSFTTDQWVIIKITADGKVLEWGTQLAQGRIGYHPGKLEPYMARVTYYGQESDSAFRGKVKSIGTCNLVYYNSQEFDSKIGKLKQIGSVTLDYYQDFENESLRGKIKSAGSNSFTFYSNTENEAYRGKLKSVGNSRITYYSTFDDSMIRGKIKSIDSYSYTWYTSLDRREYRGSLKSGSLTSNINGITYIIW